MIKTLLTVPERDNSGKPFARELWEELEQRLAAPTGGFTVTFNHQGIWEDGGIIYRDVSRRFEVSLSSWMDLPAHLDTMRWMREAFGQLTVYFEIAGVTEVWPPPT